MLERTSCRLQELGDLPYSYLTEESPGSPRYENTEESPDSTEQGDG